MGPAFHRLLAETCYTAAHSIAPDLVHESLLQPVAEGRCNLLARLEWTHPGSGRRALACLRVVVPNEAHMLAAVHLALGGLHATVNADQGIELAYALLAGHGRLPPGAPRCYWSALAEWRSALPRPPALAVISDPATFRRAHFDTRPLLVKLHGSAGGTPDGVVLPLPGRDTDVDTVDLGRARRAALDAVLQERFVLVTGYSGSDLATARALLGRLQHGRFSWVAPSVPAHVGSALGAIDPLQPQPGWAVDALRSLLPMSLPGWPDVPSVHPSFGARFDRWRRTVAPGAAAEAFGWALVDVGAWGEGLAVLERLGAARLPFAVPAPRRTGVVRCLGWLEGKLVAGGTSRWNRWALAVLAARAAARAESQLTLRASDPCGRGDARLRREAVELHAIAALLGGTPPPPHVRDWLRWLEETYRHLSDDAELAATFGARALVDLAAGATAGAATAVRAAARARPPSTGAVAAACGLLTRRPAPTPRRRSCRPGDPDGEQPADGIDAFVGAIPKVELHVHLEGSVTPHTLARLAARNGDHRVPWTAEDVAGWYRFHGYTDFLNAFVLVCDQLRRPEDFVMVTLELGARLASQNVRYAEVTFSPVAHVRRGIDASELFAALEHARIAVERRHGVQLRWCAACGTRRGPRAAMDTVEMVLTHRTRSVVSVGLAGSESPLLRRGCAPAFALAREAGLPCVVHAGETSGPESLWQALDEFGAARVAHGVRCLPDPVLVERLRRHTIPLDLCPTSNVRLRSVPSMAQHPLPTLLAEGLAVNLSTDDPAMFHTSLNMEYSVVARTFDFPPAQLADLARAGVHASLLSAEEKGDLLAQIDEVASGLAEVASAR